jgi:hypothetical protein
MADTGIQLGENSGIGLSNFGAPTAGQAAEQVRGTDGGKAYTYTVYVQVPVPTISVGIDLVGDFVLPALSRIKVPQAIQWLLANSKDIFDEVMEGALALIRAIPEVSVGILVKVGPAAVINVVLVAEKQPVSVPVPSFVLALPSIALDLDLDLSAIFPVPPPVYIRVPIPVPIAHFPVVDYAGGTVSGSVGVHASPVPPAIDDPIRLPTI